MPNETPGIAYPLWRAVEDQRLRLGLSKADVARRAKLRPQTVEALRTSTRIPQPRIIDALARAVAIDPEMARRLAQGEYPPGGIASVATGSVRDRIATAPELSPAQRRVLLAVFDELSAANAANAALRAVDPPDADDGDGAEVTG